MDAKDQEIARLRNELDKAQHEVDEVLESTKDIELQLEQDILLAEEQLEKVRRRNNDLSFEIANQKERFLQAQKSHEEEVSAVRKELATISSSYTEVKTRLRDEESKHDDLQRQERIVTTSYQDLESKYHEALERNADLEGELEAKKTTDTEFQRLRDDYKDLEAELAVLKLSRMTLNSASKAPTIAAPETFEVPSTNQSYKKKDYLTNPFVETPRAEAGQEELQRPPSRLATSNSTRYIQSLSVTIKTLREKMRTARAISEYATILPPRTLHTASPSSKTTSTGLSPSSKSLNTDSASAANLSTPLAINNFNKNSKKTHLARYLDASEIGFPGSSPKSPGIRQCATLPRPFKRQSISSLITSSPAPAKYEDMTSIRSPNRRRSMLPSVVTCSPKKSGQPAFPKTNAGRTLAAKGIFLHEQ